MAGQALKLSALRPRYTPQVQTDWGQDDEGAVDFIKHKPTSFGQVIYDHVVIAGSYTDLRDSIEGGIYATVFIPDGTYLITDNEAHPLVVHTNCKLIVGQSRQGVIINANSLSNITAVLYGHSSLTVRGVSIVGASTQTTFCFEGQIDGSYHNQTKFQDCEASGFVGTATNTGGGFYNSECHNCRVDGGSYGFNICSNMLSCLVKDGTFIGYSSCDKGTDCRAFSGYIAFYHCVDFVNCFAYANGNSGFNQCNQLTNCFADVCVTGFNACDHLENCTAYRNTSVGMYNCTNVFNPFLTMNVGVGGVDLIGTRIVTQALVSDGKKIIGMTGSGANYECDGTADDVQIALAISEMSAGSVLELLPGTYNLAATVEVNKAITIRGLDRMLCIINVAGDWKGFHCTARTEFSNLYFTGVGQTAYPWNFLGNGASYPAIELSADYCSVSSCYFDCWMGIFVHCGYHTIEGNDFLCSSAIIISWQDVGSLPSIGYVGSKGPEQIYIANNIFGTSNYCNSGIWGGGGLITVIGNKFKTTGGSIYATSTWVECIISNNLYYNGSLVYTTGGSNSSGLMDHCLISDNVAYASATSINAYMQYCKVMNNSFYGAYTDFVSLQNGYDSAGSKYNVISNNHGKSRYGNAPSGGITELGASDYNIIHDNSWCGTITRANSNSVDRNNI